MCRLAEMQHGVLATWQLETDARFTRRWRTGQWQRVAGAVLRRSGSAPTIEQSVMIGVLDAGSGAVASHATAAALWQLPGFKISPVEVTRAGRRDSNTRPVAFVHRPKALGPAHLTQRGGVPVTTLARTLFDLAGTGLPEERMARLVNLAANKSPGTLVALHDLLAELACRGRGGITTMRAVLAERPVGSVLPGSGLEMRFEELLRERGQKPLRRQVDLGGHEWLGRVDFLDEELGLIVEVDSVLHHSSPMDKRADAARDETLLAAGLRRVLRIPEEHLWYQPQLVHEAVRDARRELAPVVHRAAPPAERAVLHRVRCLGGDSVGIGEGSGA